MKKNAYAEMFAVEDQHWWYVGLHHLILLLVNIYFPTKKLYILDVGCGTGGLLSVLEGNGHESEGLDTSEDALEYCHKRGLKGVFKADINSWVPSENSYDLITAMDVLSHEWIHDEIRILKSLSSSLKSNGFLMLNYPAFPLLRRQHDKTTMMKQRYTKRMLKSILDQAGLEPVLISYRLPYAFVILLFSRFYESLNKNTGVQKSDIANIPSRPINEALIHLSRLENRIIAQGFSIPLGSSLFAVARKKTCLFANSDSQAGK